MLENIDVENQNPVSEKWKETSFMDSEFWKMCWSHHEVVAQGATEL